MSERSRAAVIPVRNATLPVGARDVARAAAEQVLVVGSGAGDAAEGLAGVADAVSTWEVDRFAPGAWADALAPLLDTVHTVVLPSSPDGRDLAPRLAAVLGRPVLASAVEADRDVVSTARLGGAVLAEHLVDGPVVVTLLAAPGHDTAVGPPPEVRPLDPAPGLRDAVRDATTVEVLPPDLATMDLSEAKRIVGGGAGLDSAERFDQLAALGTAIGASTGATRVVTDRAWVPHSRQIGTTGVVVDPELYVAFGISGAVQHTAGLGNPDHVISVNTDPHCPMMAMADLAVVSDANATVRELLERLGAASAPASAPSSSEVVGAQDG